jgi:hypothetical protein
MGIKVPTISIEFAAKLEGPGGFDSISVISRLLPIQFLP